MKKLLLLVMVVLLSGCTNKEFDELDTLYEKYIYCNSENFDLINSSECREVNWEAKIKRANDDFSEFHNWKTCDDEWYITTNEWEEHNNISYFSKIEYRIVNEYQAYIKVYEENYDKGGDIFNVSINGFYEIMCASDNETN